MIIWFAREMIKESSLPAPNYFAVARVYTAGPEKAPAVFFGKGARLHAPLCGSSEPITARILPRNTVRIRPLHGEMTVISPCKGMNAAFEGREIMAMVLPYGRIYEMSQYSRHVQGEAERRT